MKKTLSNLLTLFTMIAVALLISCDSPTFDNPGDQNGDNYDPYAGVTLKITEQPQSSSITEGQNATFSCKAEADELIVKYQWQTSPANDSNWTKSDTGSTLTLSTVPLSSNGTQVRCIVSAADETKRDTTSIVTLTVAKAVNPPVILTDLQTNRAGYVGFPLTFTLTADGTDLSYQWEFFTTSDSTWSKVGTDTSSWTLPTLTESHTGAKVRCTVSNSAGEKRSNESTIQVLKKIVKPNIVTNVADVVVTDGEEALFSIEVDPIDGVTYQWYLNGAEVGGNSNTYSFNPDTTDNGKKVKCTVSNNGGDTTSREATLTVLPKGTAPIITTQPRDTAIAAGDTAKLVLVAENGLSYQWELYDGSSWNAIAGATAATFTVSENSVTEQEIRRYRCIVTGSGGTKTSREVTVSFVVSISITSQPTNQSVYEGETATFVITAENGETYQWQKLNGDYYEDLVGETGSTLTIETEANMNGSIFHCIVSNSNGGTTVSEDVTLTVTALPVPQITGTSSVSETEVRIEWAAITGIDGVMLYRSDSETGTYAEITSEPVTDNFYNDGNLSAGKTYFYYAISNTNGRLSVSSDTVSVTTSSYAAPIITEHPHDAEVLFGEKIRVGVVAVNAESYQWEVQNGSNQTWNTMNGETGDSITYAGIEQIEDIVVTVRCRVTGRGGSVTSTPATLTIRSTKVVITDNYDHKTVSVPDTVVLEVTATNATSYQWQWFNSQNVWEDVADSTYNHYRFVSWMNETDFSRTFRCKVTGPDEAVYYSDSVKISVILPADPAIISSPTDTILMAGEGMTFEVQAEDATTYSWEYYWIFSGESTWVTLDEGLSPNGESTYPYQTDVSSETTTRTFRVRVGNGTTDTVSAPFTITIKKEFALTAQPTLPEVTGLGESYVLNVRASDSCTYRWMKKAPGGTWADAGNTTNSYPIATGTKTTLNGYSYRCEVVSMLKDTLISDSVVLNVRNGEHWVPGNSGFTVNPELVLDGKIVALPTDAYTIENGEISVYYTMGSDDKGVTLTLSRKDDSGSLLSTVQALEVTYTSSATDIVGKVTDKSFTYDIPKLDVNEYTLLQSDKAITRTIPLLGRYGTPQGGAWSEKVEFDGSVHWVQIGTSWGLLNPGALVKFTIHDVWVMYE